MAHKWKQEEIAWLRDNVPGRMKKESYPDFIKAFKADDVTFCAYIGATKRYGAESGIDTKKKKGCTPHNKGKKLTPEQYEAASHTFFKRGSKPSNTIPIGGEKIASGYTWVKVADKPNARMQENFRLKHHMLWEEHYGPIGEDELVIFLDGDPTNIRIENLQKITKREHHILNRKHLRHSDPDITRTGVATAKLMDVIYKRTTNEREKDVRNKAGAHDTNN